MANSIPLEIGENFHCASIYCGSRQCCGGGHKVSWPELVGMDGQEAKRIIERENPGVMAILVPKGNYITEDWCCNRVWVFLDGEGKVLVTPQIG